MARRGGGFRPQAPKKVTLVISVVLWLIGLLAGLRILNLPNNLGFWALVVAGLLLILGCLLDGL
jgi:predicted membrane channel-forming protein YqfA (hemolysin III family)